MAPGEYCSDDTCSYTITYVNSYATTEDMWAKYFDRLEKITWLRYSWQFNEYKKYVSAFVSPKVKLICRRMILSYSGWLARKGYKKKKGK